MALIAYMDESGTHDGSPCTVFAGWISEESSWKSFDAAWSVLLIRPLPGIRAISHIHAVDLYKGRGEFRGWPEKSRIALVEAAQTLIFRYVRFSVSLILDNSDYEKSYSAVHKREKRKTGIDSKYGVCVRMFFATIAQIMEKHFPTETIRIVVEGGHKNRGCTDTLFEELKQVAPELANFISSVDYGEKRACPGVQAADLLAYPVFLGERDGTAKFEALDYSLGETMPLDKIVNYRYPLTEEILVNLLNGQTDYSALKRRMKSDADRMSD
ncbi:MAG TPA: DUF3800 domain-containing protein [Dongiaceae bacterium]|nr:DUF3800 domain-containing protein [Dongiaceae bacterium]